MPYNLGIRPDKLKVFLYRDADFDSVLFRTDDDGEAQDWDVAPRLIFPALDEPVTWTSTIADNAATFQVDKVLTNARLNGDRVELWVADQCWAVGTVSKKGDLA